MQIQHPNSFGEIRSIGDTTSNPPPSPPSSMDPSDFLCPIREEALVLLKPDRDRARVLWFAAGALVVGFGLGWASGSSWCRPSTVVALDPKAQKDRSYRRPEIKSANKIEIARKQTPLGTGTSPKPQGISTGVARPDGEGSRTAVAASPADINLPTASIAAREPVVPAPETRPTTIEGWTVVDVRDGKAVLQGPDGIRTATPGDTVPGVGRIDSIVRWGSRWIVATANGLIATP